MCACRPRTRELDATLPGQIGGFEIEVVDHFHVIRKKTDRYNDNAPGFHSPDKVSDVGPEPRLRGRTAAALEYQHGFAQAELLVYEPRCSSKLVLIRARLRHCHWNTVCRINDL